MQKQNYIILLLSLVILTLILGCSESPFAPSTTISNQFDIKLVDIGFKPNTDLFSPDPLTIAGNQLLFRVEVTPRDTFTGEPFGTIELGNDDIGYETLIQSTPSVWLVLLSKDGYFFCDDGPLTWTPEELQLPDASERDYYKIQTMRERRIKQITLSVPSSDKAAVALLEDSNELARELYQDQWRYLVSGDWLLGEDLPEGFDEEYIRSEFEELFNQHFTLVIVDKDGLLELKYDGEIKLIATWSGEGTFTSPTFTVTYDRLITSWTGNPPGPFEYNLYSADGQFLGGTRISAEPDKKHESGNSVQAGGSYYIEIITPQEMQWTFWLEETNMP